jgi:alpha-ribazole phosphatase
MAVVLESRAPQRVRIDALRHGATVDSGFCGRLDTELTACGWLQMRHATRHAGPWDIVVTSPLRRCAAFANALATDRGLHCEVVDAFAEYGFGDWEGLGAEQLWRDDPQRLERFWRDPWAHPPPGGESMEAFTARVAQAWAAIVRAQAGRRVLLVTHGGVIRMLWHLCHSRPRHAFLSVSVPHASLHAFGVDPAEVSE